MRSLPVRHPPHASTMLACFLIGLVSASSRARAAEAEAHHESAIEKYLAYEAKVRQHTLRVHTRFTTRALRFPKPLTESEAATIADREMVPMVRMYDEIYGPYKQPDGTFPRGIVERLDDLDLIRRQRIQALQFGRESEGQYARLLYLSPNAQRKDSTFVHNSGKILHKHIMVYAMQKLRIFELRNPTQSPYGWSSSTYGAKGRSSSWHDEFHATHLELVPFVRTWRAGPEKRLDGGLIEYELHRPDGDLPLEVTLRYPDCETIRIVVIAREEDGLPIEYVYHTDSGMIRRKVTIGPYRSIKGLAWPARAVTSSYRGDVDYGETVAYPTTEWVVEFDKVELDVSFPRGTFAFRPPQPPFAALRRWLGLK